MLVLKVWLPVSEKKTSTGFIGKICLFGVRADFICGEIYLLNFET